MCPLQDRILLVQWKTHRQSILCSTLPPCDCRPNRETSLRELRKEIQSEASTLLTEHRIRIPSVGMHLVRFGSLPPSRSYLSPNHRSSRDYYEESVVRSPLERHRCTSERHPNVTEHLRSR